MKRHLHYIKSFYNFFSCYNHILAGLSVAIFFYSCAPTVQKTLPFEIPETFSDSGTEKMPDDWWLVFDDHQLNEFIYTALDSNFNLLTAWERYQAALSVVDRETSNFFPSIEGNVRSGISRPEPDFVGGENIQLGFQARYEVDLWGRIKAAVDAERFRAEASKNDYQAAAIALSAEIASTYYRLVAANFQYQLIEGQIETNKKILDLISARFGSGQIRGVDIVRQKQLIAATEEQKFQVKSRQNIFEHQLAVLMGYPPKQELYDPIDSLPKLPPLPETGIPAELVTRRPDVQRAFSELQAADREVAAAISNRYPRLSINSNLSVRANNFEGLFQDWAYSFAGNLLAPLFYGGRLSAEVDWTEAVKKQRFYEYGQTVLIAFREVEDALIQEHNQLKVISALEEQVNLASQAAEQLKIQYFNGMGNYLDVLVALDREQEIRRNFITAKLIVLEHRIALYRALAGGFETGIEVQDQNLSIQ